MKLPVTMMPPFGVRAKPANALEFSCIAHIHWEDFESKRWRHGLDGTPLADPGGDGGIADNGRSRGTWFDLTKQFEPFPAEAIFEQSEAGSVASWAGQTGDVTSTDWIGDDGENDGHRIDADGLRQHTHGYTAGSENDVRCQHDQLRRMFPNIGIGDAPTDLYSQIAPVGPT